MKDVKLTPLAQSLPASVPFVGPEAQERAAGRSFHARLGANENVFGPSPKALAAMQAAASEAWMYGDPESYDLRGALAKHHGCAMGNIVIGEGIDALLGYLVRLYVGDGTPVVTSEGAYPTFNYHVAGFGGQLHKVPYDDDHEDLGALIDRAKAAGAKLVYFANPDNPMGTWRNADYIHQHLENLPEGCLLMLDEAYIEFAPTGTSPDIDIHDPRVIRMRTFSKGYGMAGARVGYALAAETVITGFHKIRNHFGMSRISQAGALAALRDQNYLTGTIANVAKSRDRIDQIARANGLSTLPSATNFVAIDCGKDGAFAQTVLNALVADGFFVRMPFVAPQNRCIRVSAGTDADLDLFEVALPKALATAQKQAR